MASLRTVPFLPILTFHSLDDQRSVISFSPGLFRRGMARLHEKGYRTLGLLEGVLALRAHGAVPEHSIVITFDDGYRSVYSDAFPILREFEMCATVFVTVGETTNPRGADRLPPLCDRPMLSWGEMREMQKCGFTFGSHTLTHPDLTQLSEDCLRLEICRSKTILEQGLDSAVTFFAYPYGRYDSRSYALVQRYFACACSDKLGLACANSDALALERVEAYYLRTERLFDLMLSAHFSWYIAARNIPRRIRRAVRFTRR